MPADSRDSQSLTALRAAAAERLLRGETALPLQRKLRENLAATIAPSSASTSAEELSEDSEAAAESALRPEDATTQSATGEPPRERSEDAPERGLGKVISAVLKQPLSDPIPLGARMVVPTGVVDDDWSAKPTPFRPRPVILLHGTISHRGYFQDLVAELRAEGFVVFAPSYGTYATQSISTSLTQLEAYIRAVLHATGAEAVDLVGHSQGGLIARYLAHRALNGRVGHIVTLGAPHHGTSAAGMLQITGSERFTTNVFTATAEAVRGFFGEAGVEQLIGSPLITDLTATGDTLAGMRYTVIATRNDLTVTPPESTFLTAVAGASVSNILVQDEFPRAMVLHHNLPSDKRVRQIVIRELIAHSGIDPTGPASAHSHPTVPTVEGRQDLSDNPDAAADEAAVAPPPEDT